MSNWFKEESDVDDLHNHCVEIQEQLIEEFHLGSYARWFFDQKTSKLNFYDENDLLKVTADCQTLGTFVKCNKSWLFSWANSSILDHCKAKLSGLRDILFEAWGDIVDDEIDASDDSFDYSEMIPLAMSFLNAKGYYVASSEKSNLVLIITDIQWV